MSCRCHGENGPGAERKLRTALAAVRLILWIIWIVVDSHRTS